MKKHLFTSLALMALLASCKREIKSADEPEISDPNAVHRICASQDILEEQMRQDPARAQRLQELESFTANYTPAMRRFNGTLYVPVVVHVVMPDPTLVTDAQINSQIAVLNKDYNRTNSELNNSSVYLADYPYANVANCQITFVLKQVVRKVGAATYGTNDAVKTASQGSAPVNPTTWLNLWVCDLSSGLLGYAQFPGGNPATDGVVIDYQGFGTQSTGYSLYSTFNLGRTATHEIGHWFNLRHIWGDRRCGTDYVDDTPFHDDSNYGCPAVNHLSRCSGRPKEQWMNYMDYTDDRCMYMFSAGQKLRMDAAIDASRASYVSTTQP